MTKRMAEDLTQLLPETRACACKWLHSDTGNAIERVDHHVAGSAPRGRSTCSSGVNLLREGLDLPEVSLVAILDADKEGFLRS